MEKEKRKRKRGKKKKKKKVPSTLIIQEINSLLHQIKLNYGTSIGSCAFLLSSFFFLLVLSYQQKKKKEKRKKKKEKKEKKKKKRKEKKERKKERKKVRKLTGPSFSEALAFHNLMFVSSLPLTTNFESSENLTVNILCILFAWYISLLLP